MLTALSKSRVIRVLIVESDSGFNAQLQNIFDQFMSPASTDEYEIVAECVGDNLTQVVTRAAHQKEPYAIAFFDISGDSFVNAKEKIEQLWYCDSDIYVVACANDANWQDVRDLTSQPEKLTVTNGSLIESEIQQLTVSLCENRIAMLQHRDALFKISEQLQEARESLRVKNQHLELASRIARVGYGSMDLATQDIELSANACRILDIEEADFHSVSDLLLLLPRKDQIKFQLLLDEAIYRESDFEFKFCFRHRDSRQHHVIVQVTCQRDANSAKTSLFLVVRDVTRDETALQAVQHASMHDSLTTLPNRANFNERLELAVRNSRRADDSSSLILLDLDRFKEVNDSFGHPIGDGLLKEFSDRLKRCVRESDFVARLGGDEFAIIQSSGSPEETRALIDRLYRKCLLPFQVSDKSLSSTFSAGVALIPANGNDVDTILNNADLALYRAKQEGRGKCRFFDQEMDNQLRKRLRMEADLKQALERNEFDLHYQPIICTRTKVIAGMEALVRWYHPERGHVRPDIFVEVAESTAAIVPLGRWVLRRACHEAVTWPEDVTIAVNVSAVQLQQSEFSVIVREALQESGLDPCRLEIEITETAFLGNTEETLRSLNAIRELGVRVAMDDFGTGYSSLSYLRNFRFDKIKLDRSFVATNDEPESRAIISAVAGIGESLGLRTCAEGVETEEQFEIVRSEGYSHVQGFLFGRPKPASEIKKLF